MTRMFWSSAVLTGNRTGDFVQLALMQFWSSAVLTGNRTRGSSNQGAAAFWSSAVLTGNRTDNRRMCLVERSNIN